MSTRSAWRPTTFTCGYDEFYNTDFDAIARTIQQSGANVVLMQEVEAGRMTSFGIDQSLWLARRLGMDRRFYATNEGLQGLAVLSNIPIAFDDGLPLASLATQTGVQRVQVLPDPDTVVTLYNTWLSPLLEVSGGQSIEEQEQDQQRQLNEIFTVYVRQACSAALGRTILGGTMHNVPDSPLIEQMRNAQFSDPSAGLPLELSATFVRTVRATPASTTCGCATRRRSARLRCPTRHPTTGWRLPGWRSPARRRIGEYRYCHEIRGELTVGAACCSTCFIYASSCKISCASGSRTTKPLSRWSSVARRRL
ncbi:MAG: hypothetical protein U0521_04945 [Anaerolineae bacterium]